MRVWIEIRRKSKKMAAMYVTLRVRVWIEISVQRTSAKSLAVTLRVRVWIEIVQGSYVAMLRLGHPPCEGVD